MFKDKNLLELGLSSRPQSKSQERLKNTNLYQKTQNEIINKLNIDGGTTSNDTTSSAINNLINTKISRKIPTANKLQHVGSTRELKSTPRTPRKNEVQAESLSAGFWATRVNNLNRINSNLNLTSTKNLNRTNINLRDSYDYSQKQPILTNFNSTNTNTKRKRISNANNGHEKNEYFKPIRDKTPKLRNEGGISLSNQALKFKLDLTAFNKASYNLIMILSNIVYLG